MKLALLRLLADGQFHSGNALADQLGVSRTTVWKQIQEYEGQGIRIHSIRGRGYRIPQGLDLLDEVRLTDLLRPIDHPKGIEFIQVDQEVDSTNLAAQRALATGVRRALFAAEFQTGGRGRRGRSWVSPFASSLTFSLSWPFSGGVSQLEGLSLVVGLSLGQTLTQLGIADIQLKWPNDLLLNGSKLGGVLIEVVGDLSGDCSAVIGVGMNVRLPQTCEIDQPWTDLARSLPPDMNRTRLLALCVMDLCGNLERFAQQGFEPFRARWEQANAFQGASVRLLQGDTRVEGLCMGVDSTGALCVEVDGQEQRFQGGEVSLRRIDETGV